jgi:hypothetical protein
MALSEWLEIMLAEIARKREELERAREEEAKRATEKTDEQPSQLPRVSQQR